MIQNKTRPFLVEMYIFVKLRNVMYWSHLKSSSQKLKKSFVEMT